MGHIRCVQVLYTLLKMALLDVSTNYRLTLQMIHKSRFIWFLFEQTCALLFLSICYSNGTHWWKKFKSYFILLEVFVMDFAIFAIFTLKKKKKKKKKPLFFLIFFSPGGRPSLCLCLSIMKCNHDYCQLWYIDFYSWQTFENANSLRTRSRALNKPLKSDAPHFAYAFAKLGQE